MTNFAVIGAQWGDEGKGKVVDILARRFDYVIRYQGGHNAGHSVVFQGERFALHVMPSGVFNEKAVNVIANGVVVDPFQLVKEIEGLRNRGVELTPDNLKISNRMHLILPYHGIIDRHREGVGSRKIGTTGRGIGPAYEWKAARRGLRMCDVFHPEYFKAAVAAELESLNNRFSEIEELRAWGLKEMMAKLQPVLDILKPHVVDSVELLSAARAEGASLLFEGAQATLLDIDFGTYPYVTSSNSCAVGISAGAGVPPSTVDEVVGICKAYTTRVGEGPFPTELHDETGEALRKAGFEFGTTTGRPRRCGWLDLVALNYTHQLNGFSTVAIMKLDVLDELPEVKVCKAYRLNGEEITHFPASPVDLNAVEPVYETLPGWQEPTTHIRTYEELPEKVKAYIDYIEKYVGCPIGLISVGPDREQTVIRDRRLKDD
ncbi:MAG: adenylosuccinate synthase [Acidobacteriota bacterium]|nr:adenylosuccinate synthase [Acidobacteriota bacterium]